MQRVAECPRRLKKTMCKPMRHFEGLFWELNPGPLAPEARIMPLDQTANRDEGQWHDYATTLQNWKKGLFWELNPGPLAPRARIMPLDQTAIGCDEVMDTKSNWFERKKHSKTNLPNDPGKTRTCNLWFRGPTPYPLGHRTAR